MTKSIPIKRRGKVVAHALVDASEFDRLSQYSWFLNQDGYAQASMASPKGGRTAIRMHREVLRAELGQMVDHINRNRLDNRRANLRLATHAENARNASTKNEFKGVRFHARDGVWVARIRYERQGIWLGSYSTAEEAARAYDAAAAFYFRDFAVLNFPNELPGEYTPPPSRAYTSKFRGVSCVKGRWKAHIRYGGKLHHLGYFETEEEAAREYDKAARSHHGNKAKLNFS